MYDSSDTWVQYTLRFGEIAILKDFITLHELEEALAEQVSTDTSDELSPRKKIGEILFDNGYITLNQMEIILEEIIKYENQPF